MEPKALSGMTLTELQQITADLELPKFTAMQMAAWIYQKQIFNVDEMTNLSKTVRERLSATFTLGRSLPTETQTSTDGTVKYLFRTINGDYVETVYIPTEDRATLCISSQVGCKMGCKFCMTGKQGFQAQLTPVDILNQIYSIPNFDKITNIVFMGQGEPLDNLDAVLRVTELLTARYGLAWSPKRITVSTVGLFAGLKKFLDQSDCNVAISLHFPFPEERIEWMPAEKAYPIEKVVALLKGYDFCKDLKRGEIRTTNHQRRLSFEYIMFKGINDTQRHAQGLVNLLRGLDCRVNLIPFHVIPNSPLRGCNAEDMRIFRDYLTHHGVYTTIRASRGQDILAACGLLNTSRQEARKKGMRGQKN